MVIITKPKTLLLMEVYLYFWNILAEIQPYPQKPLSTISSDTAGRCVGTFNRNAEGGFSMCT